MALQNTNLSQVGRNYQRCHEDTGYQQHNNLKPYSQLDISSWSWGPCLSGLTINLFQILSQNWSWNPFQFGFNTHSASNEWSWGSSSSTMCYQSSRARWSWSPYPTNYNQRQAARTSYRQNQHSASRMLPWQKQYHNSPRMNSNDYNNYSHQSSRYASPSHFVRFGESLHMDEPRHSNPFFQEEKRRRLYPRHNLPSSTVKVSIISPNCFFSGEVRDKVSSQSSSAVSSSVANSPRFKQYPYFNHKYAKRPYNSKTPYYSVRHDQRRYLKSNENTYVAPQNQYFASSLNTTHHDSRSRRASSNCTTVGVSSWQLKNTTINEANMLMNEVPEFLSPLSESNPTSVKGRSRSPSCASDLNLSTKEDVISAEIITERATNQSTQSSQDPSLESKDVDKSSLSKTEVMSEELSSDIRDCSLSPICDDKSSSSLAIERDLSGSSTHTSHFFASPFASFSSTISLEGLALNTAERESSTLLTDDESLLHATDDVWLSIGMDTDCSSGDALPLEKQPTGVTECNIYNKLSKPSSGVTEKSVWEKAPDMPSLQDEESHESSPSTEKFDFEEDKCVKNASEEMEDLAESYLTQKNEQETLVKSRSELYKPDMGTKNISLDPVICSRTASSEADIRSISTIKPKMKPRSMSPVLEIMQSTSASPDPEIKPRNSSPEPGMRSRTTSPEHDIRSRTALPDHDKRSNTASPDLDKWSKSQPKPEIQFSSESHILKTKSRSKSPEPEMKSRIASDPDIRLRSPPKLEVSCRSVSSEADIISYWTPLRMKAALPARDIMFRNPLETRSRSASPEQEIRSRSASPEQEIRSRSASPEQEIRSSNVLPEPETRSRSASPAQEIRSRSVSPEAETRSRSASPKPETRSRSASPAQEIRSRSISPEAETRSRSASPEPETMSRSASPDPETRSRSVSPEAETRSRRASPELETRSWSASPEQEIRSRSVSPEPETMSRSASPKQEIKSRSASPETEKRFRSAPLEEEIRPSSASPEQEIRSRSASPEPEKMSKTSSPEPENGPSSASPEPEIRSRSASPDSETESRSATPEKERSMNASPETEIISRSTSPEVKSRSASSEPEIKSRSTSPEIDIISYWTPHKLMTAVPEPDISFRSPLKPEVQSKSTFPETEIISNSASSEPQIRSQNASPQSDIRSMSVSPKSVSQHNDSPQELITSSINPTVQDSTYKSSSSLEPATESSSSLVTVLRSSSPVTVPNKRSRSPSPELDVGSTSMLSKADRQSGSMSPESGIRSKSPSLEPDTESKNSSPESHLEYGHREQAIICSCLLKEENADIQGPSPCTDSKGMIAESSNYNTLSPETDMKSASSSDRGKHFMRHFSTLDNLSPIVQPSISSQKSLACRLFSSESIDKSCSSPTIGTAMCDPKEEVTVMFSDTENEESTGIASPFDVSPQLSYQESSSDSEFQDDTPETPEFRSRVLRRRMTESRKRSSSPTGNTSVERGTKRACKEEDSFDLDAYEKLVQTMFLSQDEASRFGKRRYRTMNTRSSTKKRVLRIPDRTLTNVSQKRDEIFKIVEEGNYQLVQELVQDTGAAVRREKTNCTLLHAAAVNNQPDVVLFLLQLISPNVVNKDGQTPAHLAAIKGHTQVLRILLADQELDPNKRDNCCATYKNLLAAPLIKAVAKGNRNSAQELLKLGADPDYSPEGIEDGSLPPNLRVTTPRQLALTLKREAIISMIPKQKNASVAKREVPVSLTFSHSSYQGHDSGDELQLDVRSTVNPIKGPNIYEMDTDPRGYVCILNYSSFKDRPDLQLQGSHADISSMANVFGQMGYTGDAYSSLSAEETKNVLLRVRDMDILDEVGCAIFIVSSHGLGTGRFLTADKKHLSTSWLCDLFKDAECPKLRNKPKLFIFDFYFGYYKDYKLGRESRRSYRVDEPLRDIMCLYSSSGGPTSYTFTKEGTPFVSSLCRTLANHAHDKELNDIFREFLKEYLKSAPATMPELRSVGVTKEFFFNPM